jgi:MscS family membrane protein
MEFLFKNVQNWFILHEERRILLINLGINFGIFFFFVFLSLIIGRYTPTFLKIIIRKFSPKQISRIYEKLIVPLEKIVKVTGTLILLYFCLSLIQQYTGLYQFLKFFLDIGLISSFAALFSSFFRELLRSYGIDLLRKLGMEIDELLLVFETITNFVIGFLAIVIFAQSRNINLVGLLAGLGIGGIAVAFAAQQTLQQFLGTIVLYLDRPFAPGEYIRVNLSSQGTLLARVEAIGLRSTKLRTIGKSTLIVVPNSTLANTDIENVTRGKKVMVMLYLDFPKSLEKTEQALLEKIVKESTNTLFGIDPESTKINLFPLEGHLGVRARVSFFILGSNENSIDFRKRLLELANESISQKLAVYGMNFTMQEPTLYVESQVTM